MECKVCGKDFELKLDNHYISRDNVVEGFVKAIRSEEENIFDTFDCPYCGCQNIIQERKRPAFIGSDYIGKVDDGYVEGVEEEAEESGEVQEEEQEEKEEESDGENTESMLDCNHNCKDCWNEPSCKWAANNKEAKVHKEVGVRE